MFDNYLFGLGHGLTAVVALTLIACHLLGAGRRDALHPLLLGAVLAVVLSVTAALPLEFAAAGPTPEARLTLSGLLSTAAGGLLLTAAYRIIRTARPPGGAPYRGEPGPAPAIWLLGTAGLLATGRQGLDTGLYFWATVRSGADPAGSWLPLPLLLLGSASAIGLGLLLHRAWSRLTGATLHRATGALLAVVAAGATAQGVGDLRTAGLLGGGPATAVFDLGTVLPPDSWYGVLITGALALPVEPTALQCAVWSAGPLLALVTIAGAGAWTVTGRTGDQRSG
ncbi:FTR1 family protein [Streptomyces sp. NPDC000594]|uniref:FTR1 family protein n=1 Tax=Streptomyces sp. NPDC000594 TaxID=3154261 RepID=UPI0033211E37